ncbi:MAG: HNH endonuclease [Bdellovibrionales bacterium]|nr:HNH endonuclease [Bdellovibrionales bacterium]
MKHVSYQIDENIKKLSDKNLLEQTDLLACEHRKNSVLLLRHLREVEVRRLFVDLGFASMHKYCIHKLKFSEGETQRRLTSARLLTELPEIEGKIETGALNVTNLSKIQSFLRTEKAASHPLTKEQKLEMILELTDKSTRDVEKKLVGRSHQPALLAEKFQGAKASSLLGEEFQKFEATLSKEHQKLLAEFRNLYAHELKDSGNGSVLVFLLEKAVQFKKKKLGLVKTVNAKELKNTNAVPRINSKADIATGVEKGSSKVLNDPPSHAAPLPSAPKVNRTPYRKYIGARVKKQIWQRAQASCEYRDRENGQRCGSKHALEIDHIKPLALGGTDELQNLRLLCRAHNARRAVKTFANL